MENLTGNDTQIIDLLCGGYPELAETLCESQGTYFPTFLRQYGYHDIGLYSAADFLLNEYDIKRAHFMVEMPRLPIRTRMLYICRNKKLTKFNDLHLYVNLHRLVCRRNSLSLFSDFPPNLTFLNCSDNYLTEICDLPFKLKILDCSENPLSKLYLPPNLESLNCSYCNLTELPELPESLKNLCFMGNLFKLTDEQLSELKRKNISVDWYGND
jgi:hypothetical protein